MVFRPPPAQSPFDRLKAQLRTSGLQQKDQPLWQVINTLIDLVSKFQTNTIAVIGTGGSGGLTDKTYITEQNETGSLPNSRQLFVGPFGTLDVSIGGEIHVNPHRWDVLTDGDLINPELIFAGGEVVMGHYPS